MRLLRRRSKKLSQSITLNVVILAGRGRIPRYWKTTRQLGVGMISGDNWE